MRLGKLRNVIKIRRRIESDDSGYLRQEWRELGQEFAAMKPLAAAPSERDGVILVTSPFEFMIRYRGDLQNDDEIVFVDETRTRYFRVDSFHDPDEHRRWTRILATEVEREEHVA